MTQTTVVNFEDFYERTRYRLVKNACLALTIVLILITIQNLTNSDYSVLPNIIGSLMGSLGYIFLLITKKYKPIAMLLSIGGFILISATFLMLENVVHYTTPLYMIINILFTFFTLKKVWGISIITAHFLVMIPFFFLKFTTNLANIPHYEWNDLLAFTTEYLICGFGIGYLLYLYILTSNYAEKELREQNNSLKDKNELILKQNEEMDVMLREIHHRVKNNLQVISSMLRLQFQNHPESHTKEFSEAINRINAMSLIHEKLYQSDMLTNFNLQNYLDSLASNIVGSYSTKPISIHIKVKVDSVSEKSIVPIALLFNELLTNSIKHAFTKVDHPEIKAEIKPSSGTEFSLYYADNGSWKKATKEGFGLDLVQAMTEQLDGYYELVREAEGTTYNFTLYDQL